MDSEPRLELIRPSIREAFENAFGGRKVEIVRHRKTTPGGSRRAKRAMDVVLACLIVVATAPLLALICLAVKMDGGPAIYVHKRVGFGGRNFGCYKFRTMMVGADAALEKLLADDPEAAEEWNRTQKLRRDPRVTRIGRLLRRTSMDELPQLFNVIAGDMSLVGPRPITAAELERYGDAATHCLSVRPGITGIWQVSGRNELSFENRVELDLRYVQSWTILGDVALLARTALVIVGGKGAY